MADTTTAHNATTTTMADIPGSNWAGPAAVLAIAGIAAGVAAASYYAPPPQPVYVQPQEPVYIEAPQPVYVAPPRGYWRYSEY